MSNGAGYRSAYPIDVMRIKIGTETPEVKIRLG